MEAWQQLSLIGLLTLLALFSAAQVCFLAGLWRHSNDLILTGFALVAVSIVGLYPSRIWVWGIFVVALVFVWLLLMPAVES